MTSPRICVRVATLALGLALGAALTACAHGDVGKVCSKKEDCSGDLICDVHEGQGTCQEPHGHDTSETATTAAETDTTG